ALVAARRGDIEIVVLRAHGGGLVAERFAHVSLAAPEQLEIRTGADDLAGPRDVWPEIPDHSRLAPDRPHLVRHIFAVATAREPGVGCEQPDVDAGPLQHLDAALG